MYFKIQALGIDVNLIKNTRIQLEKIHQQKIDKIKHGIFFSNMWQNKLLLLARENFKTKAYHEQYLSLHSVLHLL